MRFVTRLSAGGVLATVVLAKVGRLPFDLPMPTHAIGWVEPTCGMTRGVTAIARGKFDLAWRFNPASYLVAGVGLLGVVRSIVGISTRRWINVAIRLDVRRSVMLVVALATLWAYQQAHADFVVHGRL